jgi:hypothetical protein
VVSTAQEWDGERDADSGVFFDGELFELQRRLMELEGA